MTRAVVEDRAPAPKKKGIKGFRRNKVRVGGGELIRRRRLEPELAMPLVLEPAGVDVDLPSWVVGNKESLEADLHEHGAILFRGFKIDTVEKFQSFSDALAEERDAYDEQSSPRTALGKRVFTSTEHPPDQVIHFHNGNSYSHFWPMKIWFGCIIKSEEGGRTPISDCARVIDHLDPQIVERFERHGVMYTRNFMPGMNMPWQQVFQTDNKADVEKYCRESDIRFEWVSEDHLRIRQVRHAVATHPVTGARVWFNQAALFHVSLLEGSLAEKFKEGFSEEYLPSNSYYGNGDPIAPETLTAILDAYDAAKVSFDWQVGDVMLLDNMLVAHARTPYRGNRLITVAFCGRHYSR